MIEDLMIFCSDSTSGEAPFSISFAVSFDGDHASYSYYWDFGDGGESLEENPTHIYEEQGDYIATCTVTDSQNHQTSTSQTIRVSVQQENIEDADTLGLKRLELHESLFYAIEGEQIYVSKDGKGFMAFHIVPNDHMVIKKGDQAIARIEFGDDTELVYHAKNTYILSSILEKDKAYICINGSGNTLNDIKPDTDTSIFQPDLDPSSKTDPLNSDTDGDTRKDGEEDANHNGLVDSGESDSSVIEFFANFTPIPPVIDGSIETDEWQAASEITLVSNQGTHCVFSLMHDSESLYLAVSAADDNTDITPCGHIFHWHF